MEATHYYNGKYLKKEEINISPDDVGFSRGYAVFEFFRVENGQPIFLQDHLDRLWNSARQLNLEIPNTRKDLEEIIFSLIAKNTKTAAGIKITLTGGPSLNGFSAGKPTLLMMYMPFVPPSEAVYLKGATLMTFEYQRDLPLVKSVNYAQALALEKEWKDKGHIDVLYYENGVISEVSRSSVFVVKNRQLKTNKSDVLAGVTQKNVLRAIDQLFEVEIGDIKLAEVFDADELFITSTSKRVLPIVGVEQEQIGKGEPGEITRAVQSAFQALIKKELA